MCEQPLISVVIPAYNRIEWLREAILSVLKQTYTNWEIVLVDDGSTEDIVSMDILNNPKIRYFKNTNHGVAYSRNFGIRKATGQYVAFLDSDDFWEPRKLQIQVEAMLNTGQKWSQHNYYYYSDIKQNIVSSVNTFIYSKCYSQAMFLSFRVQTSCFMVERQAVLDAECWFDERKSFGEDTEFYIKMAKSYPLLCINEYLSNFRIRGTNAGKDVKTQLQSRAICWKEHRNDSFFELNTSKIAKVAYKMCAMHFEGELAKTKWGAYILYSIPWLIFKMESKRIILMNKLEQ